MTPAETSPRQARTLIQPPWELMEDRLLGLCCEVMFNCDCRKNPNSERQLQKQDLSCCYLMHINADTCKYRIFESRHYQRNKEFCYSRHVCFSSIGKRRNKGHTQNSEACVAGDG